MPWQFFKDEWENGREPAIYAYALFRRCRRNFTKNNLHCCPLLKICQKTQLIAVASTFHPQKLSKFVECSTFLLQRWLSCLQVMAKLLPLLKHVVSRRRSCRIIFLLKQCPYINYTSSIWYCLRWNMQCTLWCTFEKLFGKQLALGMVVFQKHKQACFWSFYPSSYSKILCTAWSIL